MKSCLFIINKEKDTDIAPIVIDDTENVFVGCEAYLFLNLYCCYYVLSCGLDFCFSCGTAYHFTAKIISIVSWTFLVLFLATSLLGLFLVTQFDTSFYCINFYYLSWWRSISYRNQSIDLQSRSLEWFLCDRDLSHEGVKEHCCCLHQQMAQNFVEKPRKTLQNLHMLWN